MLRFDVYREGDDEINLAGAYVLGQDGVAVRADLTASDSQITCRKRVAGACSLALPWDAGAAGQYILATTRLPDRRESYNLNVELARAQMLRLVQKREDWGLFDYANAASLNERFDESMAAFIESLKADDPIAAAGKADEALDSAVMLGEEIALFHADIFLERRKPASPAAQASVGCVIDLLSFEQKYQGRIREGFDFVAIPTPWKHIEPKEREHEYSQIDAWINWAAGAKKPVCAGPLVSFDPGDVPDWLYIWENNYEALRDLIYEHIQHVVKRYKNKVRVWNVLSGIHAHNTFNLSFEQIMELTRMSCLLVKKLAPNSRVMIELVMPWGEYYARNQRTVPPLLYADMAIQSGVKFDTFGVQVCMGAPVDGLYVRDMLQISSLLDEFVTFGKTVQISACEVPSEISPHAWDAWRGKKAPAEAGRWREPWSDEVQAQWLGAFGRISISKPFVESICWKDLADYDGHYVSHGGLCGNDMQPKASYRQLCDFRAFLAEQVQSNPANSAGGR
ncbi:MAG: endo-1,4-beta-xylanase [Planctomycetes bacterium]|nr:endo-1,4-beta-xylanase [Planctomycetota bacterium]